MAKFTRKDLKHDAFVEEVGHRYAYFQAHRTRIIGIAVAVIVAIVGATAWAGYQRTRDESARMALQDAIRLYHGVVTTEQRFGYVTFATTGERVRRVTEAFETLQNEYGGKWSAVADYYLGLLDVEQQKLDEAREKLERAVEGADKQYASLARLTLASVLANQDDVDEAKRHYQRLIDNPSDVVPAQRAKLELGRMLAEKDPEAAKPILEELMAEPGPASNAAGAVLRRISGA